MVKPSIILLKAGTFSKQLRLTKSTKRLPRSYGIPDVIDFPITEPALYQPSYQ